MTNKIFYNDCVQRFNDILFEDILTIESVVTKKRAIKIDDTKCYGYFLEKKGVKYFIQDFPDEDKSVLDMLPIRITDKTETDYSKQVFYFVNNFESVKIPAEQKLSFRELVDTISNFKHANPKHFLLYKIITMAGYVNRINYRVIAERGFGKDCMVNNLHDLLGNIANIYGATMAKLEYSLKHIHLIFNEMGNLKSDERYSMQQFLLAVGAFFNSYTKRSRATEDTLEEYNISKTSLGILYNPPMYYAEKGQQFFDQMFTKAVINRFIPFYLEGTLTEKFEAHVDVNNIVKENMEVYKNVISTILYYQNRPVSNKYVRPDDIVFGDDVKRYERTFTIISNFISEYAKDEQEYYELLYELYASYQKYDSIISEVKIYQGDKK